MLIIPGTSWLVELPIAFPAKPGIPTISYPESNPPANFRAGGVCLAEIL
jgi:hypothetical protein